MSTILLVILVLLLVGAFPAWPYSQAWGLAPSGVLGIMLALLVVMILLGRI